MRDWKKAALLGLALVGALPACAPELKVEPLIDGKMWGLERFGISSKQELREVLLQRETWGPRNYMWIATWLNDFPTQLEIGLELMQRDPSDLEAYAVVANAYLTLKEYQKAIEILDQAAEHKLVVRDFRSNYNAPWVIDDLRAQALIKLERYEEVVEAEKKVGDQDGARGHRFAARALLRLKRYDEALAEARTSVALAPKDAYSHWMLALAQTALLQIGEAQRSIDFAAELNPNFRAAYFAQQHRDASLNLLMLWTERDFYQITEYWLPRCGHYYLDLDLPTQAERCFEAAEKIVPDSSLHMKVLHQAESDPAAALRMAEGFLANSRQPDLLTAAGWVAFLSGDPVKARSLIEEGIQANPVGAISNLRLGTVCEALGDSACAKKAFALTIQPTSEDVGNAVIKFLLLLLPILLVYLLVRGLVVRRMRAAREKSAG